MPDLSKHPPVRTANERWKESFQSKLAVSLCAAVILHLLVFLLFPEMQVTAWTLDAAAVSVVPIDEIELPPAPEPLPRPRLPVVGSDAVLDDVTIDPIAWREAAGPPPPPPADTSREATQRIPFTPWTVPPRLANPGEVERALERVYPATLRDAGIGGTVALLVHIDGQGRVLEARLGTSSGVDMLDAAALRVIDAFRFLPAQNRDKNVEVWIRIPVTFESRDGEGSGRSSAPGGSPGGA